jgi:GrpB-like predicted nucleotidyltransferase (UPF0157 family)
MTIGLKKGTVQLRPHNPRWTAEFAKEKKLLGKTLGAGVCAIEHIGSTAIPTVPAKPIIDIAVGIPRMAEAHRLIPQLKKAGYTLQEHASIPHVRLFFTKGSDAKRTHYIHLVRHNGAVWKKFITFRNHLCTNKKDAKKYAALKRMLAKKFGGARTHYTEGKAQFIRTKS